MLGLHLKKLKILGVKRDHGPAISARRWCRLTSWSSQRLRDIHPLDGRTVSLRDASKYGNQNLNYWESHFVFKPFRWMKILRREKDTSIHPRIRWWRWGLEACFTILYIMHVKSYFIVFWISSIKWLYLVLCYLFLRVLVYMYYKVV